MAPGVPEREAVARVRAFAELGRRNQREGLALLRLAVATDPDDVGALTVLGVALMHTVRQGEDGERLLDRAVQLAPHDPDVAYARALALEHRSIVRWDKAREAVGLALALAPDDPRVRLVKAKVDLGQVGWLHDSGRADVAAELRSCGASWPPTPRTSKRHTCSRRAR